MTEYNNNGTVTIIKDSAGNTTVYQGDDTNNFYNGTDFYNRLYGNGGDDWLRAGNGFGNTLVGGAGADILESVGFSRLYSDGERSVGPLVLGADGNFIAPVIDTGLERDTLIGDDWSQTFFAGYGDSVDGGGSEMQSPDQLNVSFILAPNGITFDGSLSSQVIGGGTIANIRAFSLVVGTNFADTIKASLVDYSPTTLMGGGGNDMLFSGLGDGRLYGGSGDDIIDARGSVQALYAATVAYGETGDDTFYMNIIGRDSAFGGEGNDTFYSYGSAFGDGGNDTINLLNTTGTAYASGGDGADLITASTGNDVLYSATSTGDFGVERDVISAGGGDDLVSIGINDVADGGTGNDILRLSLAGGSSGVVLSTAGITGAGPYTYAGTTITNFEILGQLRGTEFADQLTIAAQPSAITVEAGGGNDIVTVNTSGAAVSGGSGDDVVVATAGTVTVNGGDGDDRFVSGVAADWFEGGAGIDTIDYANYASAVQVFLGTSNTRGTGAGGDTLINVENIIGSAFDDTLVGNDVANTITGGAGNDYIDGALGADTMIGGTGDDTYVIDNAGDVVIEAAGEGNDRVITNMSFSLAGSNIERVETSSSAGTTAISLTGNDFDNMLTGNAGQNQLDGGAGNDTLNGGGGDDTLNGGDGNDTLDGGTGNDVMTGGTGNDIYVVDSAGDVINEAAGGGTDEVRTALASYSITALANVENLTGTSTARQTLIGNEGANTITAGPGGAAIGGNGGSDLIIGGAGDDVLSSNELSADGLQPAFDRGTGRDIVTGGAGNDVIGVGIGDDADGGAGQDALRLSFAGATSGVTFNSAGITGRTPFGFAGGTIANFESFTDLRGSEFADTLTIAPQSGPIRIDAAAGDDYINISSGTAEVTGGAGNDLFVSGTGVDTFYGGAGIDTVNYSRAPTGVIVVLGQNGGVSEGAGSNGRDYLFDVENVSGTDFGDSLTGNNLDNTIFGFNGADIIDGGAGIDVLIGGNGDDVYFVDNASDRVFEYDNAGAGVDTVRTAMTNYTLAANVERLIYSGTTQFNAVGNAGDNVISGGKGGDTFDLSSGGVDGISGLAGNDSFSFGATLTAADSVDGGAGSDQVNLAGNYTGATALVLGATTITNVEKIALSAGDYAVTTADATVAAGQTLTVDGASLGAGDTLFFDGQAERDGRFVVNGGQADDTILGGAGADTIFGGGGADRLTGGAGADTFSYGAVSQSASVHFDTIVGFDGGTDRIDLSFAVTGIDTARLGSLSGGTFDSDLTAALTSLGAHHAVSFTADAGDFAGRTFEVIDANGLAGYQAGQDMVIELLAPFVPVIDPGTFI